jgi:outer membrane protein OmpA-like peptidoglycan-associated protein
MKSFKLLLVAALLTFGNLLVNAQTTTTTTDPMPKASDYNTWSIGINGGITLLYGNVTTEAYYKDRPVKDPGLYFGATVKKSLSHLFGLEAQFAMGDIKGKNVYGSYFDGQHRFNNLLLNGESDAKGYDLSINGVFTLGNFSWLSRKAKKFNLVGSIGWGYINFDPSFTSNFNQKTSTLDTTGVRYSKRGLGNTDEFIVPAGVGIIYNASKHFNILLKYRYTVALGSKLDYTWDPAVYHESYGYAYLGLIYIFGKKEKNIDWVNPAGEIYEQISDVKKKIDGLAQTVNNQLADMHNTIDSAGKATDKKLDDFGKRIDGLNSDFNNLKTTVNNMNTGGSGFFPSVYFPLDVSAIQYSEYENLASIAIALKDDPKLKLKIIGHCDQSGSEQYNQALGERRAKEVKDHLVKVYGIDASRLSTESKGKTDHLAKDIDSINRRVDFKLVK